MIKLLKKKMTWIAFGGVVLVMLFLCFGVLLDSDSISDAQTGESISYSQYDLAKERETGAAGTVLVWGITVLSFGILYGYQTSWNAALQMDLPSSPFDLTMGQAIGITAVLLLLSALLHSILTLLLSAAEKKLAAQEQEAYHVKHDMVGVQRKLDALMVVYILGTLVIHVPERLRLLSQSLYLLPAKMVDVYAFYDVRLVGKESCYLTNWQAGMLLYPLLAILLALLGD